MTKDEVAALALNDRKEQKPDEELALVAAKYGAVNLACDFEGLDRETPHKSDEFLRANPFVHFALRDGTVQAVTKELSHPDAVKAGLIAGGSEVPHAGHADNQPVTHTVFKGE